MKVVIEQTLRIEYAGSNETVRAEIEKAVGFNFTDKEWADDEAISTAIVENVSRNFWSYLWPRRIIKRDGGELKE